MWFCAGQAGAEFALVAGLRTACGATYCQRILRFDFHAYTMRGLLTNKMFNCDHRAVLLEAHHFCKKEWMVNA